MLCSPSELTIASAMPLSRDGARPRARLRRRDVRLQLHRPHVARDRRDFPERHLQRFQNFARAEAAQGCRFRAVDFAKAVPARDLIEHAAEPRKRVRERSVEVEDREPELLHARDRPDGSGPAPLAHQRQDQTLDPVADFRQAARGFQHVGIVAEAPGDVGARRIRPAAPSDRRYGCSTRRDCGTVPPPPGSCRSAT